MDFEKKKSQNLLKRMHKRLNAYTMCAHTHQKKTVCLQLSQQSQLVPLVPVHGHADCLVLS